MRCRPDNLEQARLARQKLKRRPEAALLCKTAKEILVKSHRSLTGAKILEYRCQRRKIASTFHRRWRALLIPNPGQVSAMAFERSVLHARRPHGVELQRWTTSASRSKLGLTTFICRHILLLLEGILSATELLSAPSKSSREGGAFIQFFPQERALETHTYATGDIQDIRTFARDRLY
jgi:hypothetical protein